MGVVEVILDQPGVIRLDEVNARQVIARLKAGAIGCHGHTVVAHRSGWAEARAFACVAGACDIVDVAALIIEIYDAAHGEIVGHRHIEHGFGLVARLASLGEGRADTDPGVKARQIGLVGDEPHDTSLRTRSEQGALRPGKNFDPFEVGGIDVEITTRLCQRLLVEIKRNVGSKTRDARRREVWRGRRKAANIDRALAGAATASSHCGQLLQIIVEGRDVQLVELFLTQGLNRNRYVLQIFAATLGGDNDGCDAALARLPLSAGPALGLRGGSRSSGTLRVRMCG